jgi:hypothetical protein
MCYSASNCLCIFCCCFCCWVIFLMHCFQIEFRGYFYFLLFAEVASCPKTWSILMKVPVLLRRMYIVWIVWIFGWIFCRHQLGPFDLWCDLVSRISLLSLCLDDLSIGNRGVLKSLTTTVLESICPFTSFRVCLMKLGALILGAYKLIILISFWCISLFISMKCPSFSHLTNVSLKSTLSDISVDSPACFLGPMA